MSQDEIGAACELQKIQGDIVTLKRHKSEDVDKVLSDMFSLSEGYRFASFTAVNFLEFEKRVIGEGKESIFFKKEDIEKDISLFEAVVSDLTSVLGECKKNFS